MPPEASRTQKLTSLSATAESSIFCSTRNWPEPFVSSRPRFPEWAAPAVRFAVPVPSRPFQAVRSPDSKPSENRVFVYPGFGVIGDDAGESRLVPIPLIAATVKVYAVPSASPVTV